VANFFNLTTKYNNEFFSTPPTECSNEILLLSFFVPGDSGGSGRSLCAFIPWLFLRRKRGKKNYVYRSSVADNKAYYAPLNRISLGALNALAFFRYLDKKTTIPSLLSPRKLARYARETNTKSRRWLIAKKPLSKWKKTAESDAKVLRYFIVGVNFCGRLYRKYTP